MTINLEPTAEELENLRLITVENLDNISQYREKGILEFQLPFSEEDVQIINTVLDVLYNGGRILVLTPESDIPQELTIEV